MEVKVGLEGEEILDDQEVCRSGEWVSVDSSDGGRTTTWVESCFNGGGDTGEAASKVGDSCSMIER